MLKFGVWIGDAHIVRPQPIFKCGPKPNFSKSENTKLKSPTPISQLSSDVSRQLSLDLRYATPQLVSQLSSAATPAQFSLSARKSQPASRFSLATAQCSLASRALKVSAHRVPTLSYGNLYFDEATSPVTCKH
ncbi:hypothetical protein KY290_026174 [Solanum tuberosum]|uniref:Uncharacterized protein n=1 Tax=Solanum tuberosum TaxID=4113 RepID=A0ABQ7UXC2_SOLTU|nr:hypothetical protein KY285_025702 [Solanum tuberosum]KAH0755904.1 hypothetical protein KY290_026174 [Solanum tuberosum]